MMIPRGYTLLLLVSSVCIVIWIAVFCTNHSASAQVTDSVIMADAISQKSFGWLFTGSMKSDTLLSKAPSKGSSDTSRRFESMPPYPFKKSEEKPGEKAKGLFKLARRENTNLRWNDCLAAKALQRAKHMVEKGQFDHRDPRTGENPAWSLVAACFDHNYAGENLAKSEGQPARVIHEKLMESPTHRRNIINPDFNLIGVGCYEYICVELFAGI